MYMYMYRYEAVCLAEGATSCTTIEYNDLGTHSEKFFFKNFFFLKSTLYRAFL